MCGKSESGGLTPAECSALNIRYNIFELVFNYTNQKYDCQTVI